MALTQIEVPYTKNYDFGVGVDVASQSPMGKAVVGDVSGVEGAAGSTVSFSVDRVYTTSEMSKKMGISVEAGGGCGVFSASARFDFASSCQVQSSSLFMVATAHISLKNLSIDDPALSPAATEVVNNPAVFSTRFGNMFVRGIDRGGLCIGVIQVDTETKEETEFISVGLSGSYGLFSAEGKTKFETAIKSSKSNISIRVYHEGGPENLEVKDPTDPMEIYQLMNDFLQSFHDDPEKNAVPYNVTLAPLAIANGPVPPNEADVQLAQDVLSICATARANALDEMNLMNYILKNSARFDFPPPTTVDSVAAAVQNYELDLQLIGKAASRTMNDVSKAVTPAAFAEEQKKEYPAGKPPSPTPVRRKGELDGIQTTGQRLVKGDALLTAIRDAQPEGPSRRGFEIGVGTMAENTAWGPGSRKLQDSLIPEEQAGFTLGAEVCRQRNLNYALATRGAEVTAADPGVLAARGRKAAGLYWLGFDIATGHFGNPKLGADGSTEMGPGAEMIRESLTLEAQKGFDDSFAYHHKLKYV